MTREEVLKATGISGEKLRRWVNGKLAPSPERGNRGRAGGRWSEYPIETPWEIFASEYLLKDNSMKQVAEVRQEGRRLITDVCFEEMDGLNASLEKWQQENAIVQELEGERGMVDASYTERPNACDFPTHTVIADNLAFLWLMTRIKTEHSISIETPIRVYIDYSGYWTELEWANFSNVRSNTFPCDVEGYIVDWSIDHIKQYTDGLGNDEIVIQDTETKAKIILKARKRRAAN